MLFHIEIQRGSWTIPGSGQHTGRLDWAEDLGQTTPQNKHITAYSFEVSRRLLLLSETVSYFLPVFPSVEGVTGTMGESGSEWRPSFTNSSVTNSTISGVDVRALED
ncbi:hypothetical protein HOY80DRAFT_1040137 [Tuber brumale]|nr:hypothetical protein HOY80DRAFT_1040137 [Tuber brumale]